MDEETRRKIFHLSQFIDEDLERCLVEALEQAKARNLRDRAQIEKLAQETSLEIGQVLLKAKKEFTNDSAVSAAMMKKVEACDAAFSMSFIVEHLCQATGVALVDEVREKIMKLISSGRGKNPQGVAAEVQQLISEAAKKAQAELGNAEQTLNDLNALASQHGDAEKLAPRLQ